MRQLRSRRFVPRPPQPPLHPNSMCPPEGTLQVVLAAQPLVCAWEFVHATAAASLISRL